MTIEEQYRLKLGRKKPYSSAAWNFWLGPTAQKMMYLRMILRPKHVFHS